MGKIYRGLTEDEILQLKSQSCLADDWGKVFVAEDFTTEYVHHTRFSGEVKLGVFQSDFTLPGGIKKHAGLRHVTLHNVTVGDNCCIENIQNYIANYEIGDNARKKEHYALIQELARRFKEKNGTIICRELLHLDKGIYEATPEVRSTEYYKKRPCREMVEDAAYIFAQYVQEQEAKESSAE